MTFGSYRVYTTCSLGCLSKQTRARAKIRAARHERRRDGCDFSRKLDFRERFSTFKRYREDAEPSRA